MLLVQRKVAGFSNLLHFPEPCHCVLSARRHLPAWKVSKPLLPKSVCACACTHMCASTCECALSDQRHIKSGYQGLCQLPEGLLGWPCHRVSPGGQWMLLAHPTPHPHRILMAALLCHLSVMVRDEETSCLLVELQTFKWNSRTCFPLTTGCSCH